MSSLFPAFDAALFWNTLFEKGLLASIAAVLAFQFNKALAKYKGALDVRAEAAVIRATALAQLRTVLQASAETVEALRLLPHTSEWHGEANAQAQRVKEEVGRHVKQLEIIAKANAEVLTSRVRADIAEFVHVATQQMSRLNLKAIDHAYEELERIQCRLSESVELGLAGRP